MNDSLDFKGLQYKYRRKFKVCSYINIKIFFPRLHKLKLTSRIKVSET